MLHRVDLLARSTNRLLRAMRMPKEKRKDPKWWWFMRKEAWIHLKQSLKLIWAIWRRKE